jgi:hypothetical protein
MPLHRNILEQINSINIKENKPLIISDVDEVLVYFATPLENYLDTKNMSISFISYKLFGNVHYKDTNKNVPKDIVIELLQSFFAEKVHTCPPVEGVENAFKRLREKFQIIILTNTPYEARTDRIKALKGLGLDFPLVANDGHKGQAVREICKNLKAPALFLDDIPHHHTSVAELAPHVHRVHFVADPRLAKLLPPACDSHERIDNWVDAERYINKYFAQNS